MQSYSSKSSCPNRCPFKSSGCYAEGIRTVKTWERADDESDKRFVSSQDDLTLALLGGVMTVNVSTDSVLEARIAKAKGFNTVLTSVNPKDDIRLLREVHGLTAVQCPAQTREGITCKGCRLCAKDREAIVVFGIHGAHKGKARKAIQIHQAKLAR